MGFIFSIIAAALFGAILARTIAKGKKREITYGAIAVSIATIWGVILIVPPENGAVKVLFGKVDQKVVLTEGINFVNPFASYTRFNHQRQIFEVSSKGASDENSAPAVALTKDLTPLTIDVVFPYKIKPTKLLPKLYQKLGNQKRITEELIKPAARAALRDGVREFIWQQATTSSREEVAARMREYFQKYLTNSLLENDVAIKDSTEIILALPVQLRKTIPPVQITDAVSDKLAAVEVLKKQETLTKTAEEIAKRRIEEGKGITNLFTSLPKGFDAKEIALILNAMADKQRADAIEKAVNNGQVKMILMSGGVTPAINIP